MRIAISTDGKNVSPHFGRCPSFTLVDLEEGKVVNKVEVENPGHAAGYIPQFLHEKGVQQIVCGGMGMRAQGLFTEFGVETILGVEGSINSVIEKLEQGLLESKESLCKPGAGRGYGVEKNECDHAHN
mgnify:FL=1